MVLQQPKRMIMILHLFEVVRVYGKLKSFRVILLRLNAPIIHIKIRFHLLRQKGCATQIIHAIS